MNTHEGVSPLIAARNIVKRFGTILANDRVDFDLRAGEVHALLGENGAGKTTLCKILCGYYRADSGRIEVEGSSVSIAKPADAHAHGIGMVFQNFSLIPAMSVLENIALFLPDLTAVVDEGKLGRLIAEQARRLHISLDPSAPVGQLTVGDQQKVEILKLLIADVRVLILDEPTKLLAPHEAEALLEIVRELKAAGYAVVFIAHKLREVLACADRITVMRRGRTVECLDRRDATADGLARQALAGTLFSRR